MRIYLDRKCWVLRYGGDLAGTGPVDDGEDVDPHFESILDALFDIARRAAEYDADDEHERAVRTRTMDGVQLPHPCFEVTCDSCGADAEEDAGGCHFQPGTFEAWAPSAGWTTDGTTWHCPECPPLFDPTLPGPNDVPLPLSQSGCS